MTAIQTLQENLRVFLEKQGIRTQHTFPQTAQGKLTAPQVLIALEQCEAKHLGFQGYLGERLQNVSNAWEEVYAKRLSLTFSLTLLVPKEAGELALQALGDEVLLALTGDGVEDLQCDGVSLSASQFNAEWQCFAKTAQVKSQALLYAVQDTEGCISDFYVKGGFLLAQSQQP